jgi:Xaa-Pro dipeptidase
VPLVRVPDSWLVYVPGQRPKVIFHQPHDYWHVVPGTPSGAWTEHMDVVVIRKPEEALQHLPKNAARCAILGEPQSALGDFVPNNPPAVVAYLEYERAFKTAYEVEMMRGASRIGVRAHRAAERAFRAGASEFGIHLAYCQARGPGRQRPALQQHRRAQRTRRGAALHRSRQAAAQARAQLPHRRRREQRGLRVRHHAHVFA